VTRLIARYRASGALQPAHDRRHRFPQRYTRADIELLATVDEAHETLSGPATRRILEREYQDYGKPEVDEKGRQQRLYRRYQTPLETLLALSPRAPALRPGLSVAVLQRIAAAVSDTEAAQRMQQAKGKLFEQLRPPAEGRWK
jgi:hypothetical protein